MIKTVNAKQKVKVIEFIFHFLGLPKVAVLNFLVYRSFYFVSCFLDAKVKNCLKLFAK